MIPIVSGSLMQKLEALDLEKPKQNERDFVKRAGLGISQHIESFIRYHARRPELLLLCGKGHNGADAYAAATELLPKKYKVSAARLFKEGKPLTEEKKQSTIKLGGQDLYAPSFDKLQPLLESWLKDHPKGVIVDGLFGVGLEKAPTGDYAKLICWANETELPILAIDIPSGISADNGPLSPCIDAQETYYMGLPKIGFFINGAWPKVKQLKGVNFGMSPEIIEKLDPDAYYHDFQNLPPLPKLALDRHKYSLGAVDIIAGTQNMPGAASLACLSAMRAGASIVFAHFPDQDLAVNELLPVEVVRKPYKRKLELSGKAHAILIGPGLGRSKQATSLLKQCLKEKTPLIIDADALHLLDLKKDKIPKKTILTPHLGELSQLLNKKIKQVDLPTSKDCTRFAKKHQVFLLVKGAPTYLFTPDSEQIIFPTLNPGLATAGTGDVFAGILVALLAQYQDPQQALIASVYLHHLAGLQTAQNLGTRSMIASDLIQKLPLLIRGLSQKKQSSRS